MQNSAVRLKAIKTGGNSMNPTPAMSLNLLSGAISSLVTFSRSTVATVTDFEGVIKKTKINEARFDGMRRVENLLTYSQDFSNAAWVKTNLTVSANTQTAPDGTTTASTITATSTANTFVYQTGIVPVVGANYTISRYVKSGTKTFCTIEFYTLPYAFFDLTNLTYNFTGTNTVSASIVDVGNGWRRISATWTATASSTVVFFAMASSLSSSTGLTVGDTLYYWGAQLESVQGQTNQNPSEYISTNVLSYPYQGAGVDGVQYFPYTNPNCAINGAITQIPTTPINSSNSKWAYNCTTAGDYFSTPSSTANRITGDLSLLAQVALDDWTPTTVQCLIVKDGVSTGTRSWAFNVQTSGAPRLNYSLDGTNILSATATVATGFTDRTVHYVGVQRESSTGIIRFYTSEDGRTFTQLGADVAGTAGSLYDATTQPVQFGNLSGLSFALDGKIYDSHVYSGLKFSGTSTMVMDFDPSNWTSGTTFTGLETGEVWTLNNNAKIYQGLWDATGPSSLLIEEQRINVFLNSTAPATQSYTTSATPYTLSFYGSGTITLSGSYVAVVAGIDAYTRKTLTFTPTAATLVMTVTGTITSPQLEAGSFATSPIVTAGAQVTRAADQASITGTNFSSWYNQAQGSLYCQFDYPGYTGTPMGFCSLSDMWDGFYIAAATTVTAQIEQGSKLSNIYTVAPNTPYKIMLSYAQSNYASAMAGVVSTSATVGPVTNLNTRLSISSLTSIAFPYTGHIRKISYYATALPSAVLQSLTS